jgi:hypothetical protein
MNKDILEIAKELGALIEKIKAPEVKARFDELQQGISQLVAERVELQKKLDAVIGLKWNSEKRLYFRDKDPVPFCPRCKESRQKEVHLLPLNAPEGGVIYACPLCQQRYPAPWSRLKTS